MGFTLEFLVLEVFESEVLDAVVEALLEGVRGVVGVVEVAFCEVVGHGLY